MRAIQVNKDTQELFIGEVANPIPAADELLVRVKATALNRADLLQKRGHYPPPPGASDIIGLEIAGGVAAIGSNVTDWQVGDRVCALLPGGGYAEYVTIPTGMAIRIPDELSFEEAAAIPEAFLTAYLGIFQLAAVSKGDNVLIHAGASGVGTAAIQLAREAGARAFVTVGDDKKAEVTLSLGAQAAINYKTTNFHTKIKELTDGRGVDIILDCIGASYWQQNIDSLAIDGRLVIISTMGGSKVDGVNLSDILRRRLQIIGTALRSRSLQFKIDLTHDFAAFAMPRFVDDRLVPVIDRVVSWTQANQAHSVMEQNLNIGKIVMRIE